ncbi:MAG: ABC transporter permease, partial [Caulobacterales bacterium]|nr:ABC transporter permease [Caulobacterales bacterium]
MVAIFVLVRSIPGDPALLMVGDLQDPDVLRQVRMEMGLDRSVLEQFAIWAGNMVTGDWGASLRSGESVFELVWRRFSVTASVVVASVIMATLIGGAAGLWAARHQNGLIDRTITAIAGVIVSTPSFWLGLLALYTFAIWLGAAPVVGISMTGEGPTLNPAALVLPIAVLTIAESAAIARIMRATALEMLNDDYVAYARSKGLGEATIMFKHVLKNAAAPTLTLIGLILGNLLGGAAVIETV